MYCIILIARTQDYTAKFKMASSKCAILDLAASAKVDLSQVLSNSSRRCFNVVPIVTHKL